MVPGWIPQPHLIYPSPLFRSGGIIHYMRASEGICVVTHPLSKSGENATRTLLNILAELTTVSLITADLPSDSEIRHKFPVKETTRSGVGESISVAAFRFLLNQIKMTIAIATSEQENILFFGATTYVIPVLFARAIGRNVIIEPRGDVPLTLRLDWEDRIPSWLAWLLVQPLRLLEAINYRLATAIITYTPSMADELNLSKYHSKLYTDGARYVDTDRFAPTDNFQTRGKTVGFVGRLDREKGIDILSETIRFLSNSINFVFIGGGPLEEHLKGKLADEIEAGQVELTGWISHDRIPEKLSQLRLLVLPSQPTEGLPTTILEALSCGTPVLATPVSGVPDVVMEKETGFLLTDSNPRAIATRIEEILSDEELSTVSKNGRKLIQEQYSFQAAVKRYERILSEIC